MVTSAIVAMVTLTFSLIISLNATRVFGMIKRRNSKSYFKGVPYLHHCEEPLVFNEKAGVCDW